MSADRDPRVPGYWRAVLIMHAVRYVARAFALGLPARSAIAGAFIRVARPLCRDTSARGRDTFAPAFAPE